jgi:TPR repeat protein
MNQKSCFDDLLVRGNDGDPGAQFKLGEFYRQKNGVGSLATAARWFSLAANQDYAPAQLALALLYLDGTERIVWDHDARYWLGRAVHNGCQESSLILDALKEESDGPDITDILVEAEAGDPQSQFEYGYMLLFGLEMCQDTAAGLSWLFQAAVAGHPKAQVQIATSYLFGEHVKEDSSEAMKWISLSARQNEPSAVYYMGYCYHLGIEVTKNDARAAACLLQAARLGNCEAQFHLARFYYEGIGLTENLEQAQSWCEAAAGQGHEEAKEYATWNF